MSDNAKITLPNGETLELPVYKGTLGQDVIDVRSLTSQNVFTFDPGFVSTASCESKITFIDGAKGVLLHRGYPIDQLAEKADYLDTCYLLINGELPNQDQKTTYVNTIKNHTMLDENMKKFYDGFRSDAHPMAIM